MRYPFRILANLRPASISRNLRPTVQWHYKNCQKRSRSREKFHQRLYPDVCDPKPELMLQGVLHGTSHEPPDHPEFVG